MREVDNFFQKTLGQDESEASSATHRLPVLSKMPNQQEKTSSSAHRFPVLSKSPDKQEASMSQLLRRSESMPQMADVNSHLAQAHGQACGGNGCSADVKGYGNRNQYRDWRNWGASTIRPAGVNG